MKPFTHRRGMMLGLVWFHGTLFMVLLCVMVPDQSIKGAIGIAMLAWFYAYYILLDVWWKKDDGDAYRAEERKQREEAKIRNEADIRARVEEAVADYKHKKQ